MEHLTAETLARLVDDVADTGEADHLRACAACRAELDELRAQTEALAALPEIMPPGGDWKVLEARLRSEGLVRDQGLFEKLGLARTPTWMRSAAAVLLFLSGAGTGAAIARSPALAERGGSPERTATVEDAATAVRSAEERYVTAVSRYRELLAAQGGEPPVDPLSRFAALEHLVLVSQAAVRQAPGDPFLNGFLASARAERDAAARLVSAQADDWF